MPSVILDSSLALQWVLPDERTPEAMEVLAQWQQGTVKLHVPPLFWAELANGLYQALRRDRITEAQAREALAYLTGIGLDTIPEWDSREAFDLAVQHRARAVYDFVYVATARQLQLELWSGDRRLVNTVGPNAGVRYIGN